MSSETAVQPDVPRSSPMSAHQTLSFRQRIVRGIGWELAGQFGMQFWRFGSNLLLTRLLLPEAFGLIGMVQVFMMTLTMFSDLGLHSSVIHDARGDDRRFLDNVWTVGVIRGFVMWLGTWLIAIPCAWFFDMPEIAWLLPVTGLSAVIRGFASTSVLTANRQLRSDWTVRVELGSQVIGSTITILLALWLRSALALAWGWSATAAAFTVFSYCHRGARLNQFCWDRDIIRSLSHFGRWAMASGVFTVIQQQGDRVALGKVISLGDLGTYVIGANIAMLPMTLFTRLNQAIAQPVYARVRDLSPVAARARIRRFRLALVLAHVPILAILVVFGQTLVALIYRSQYHHAGWYCALAALAGLVRVGSDMGPVFMAQGDSWSHFKIMAARTLALIVAMLAGYAIGLAWEQPGNGLLYGAVVAPLLAYPYQAAMYQRINVWFPEIDLLALVPAGLLVLGQALGVF